MKNLIRHSQIDIRHFFIVRRLYNPAMFRLTREVRFAINLFPDEQLAGRPANSYGGFPSLTALGHYLTLQVTLQGEPEPKSNYLRNIKEIDDAVRRRAIPVVNEWVRANRFGQGDLAIGQLFQILRDAWPPASLHGLSLFLSPYLSLTVLASEYPMIRLSQKFEFSASHRLYNPALSDEENRATFGKCSNPRGHGHNYELQVTLAGKPDENSSTPGLTRLMDIPTFERIVTSTVIDRFDHKNLNVEISEFKDLNPSVENIAMTIYKLLKPRFQSQNAKLASVTVWETPRTWCEYWE